MGPDPCVQQCAPHIPVARWQRCLPVCLRGSSSLPSPPLRQSLDPALYLLCSPLPPPLGSSCAGWAAVKAQVSEGGRGSQPREPGAAGAGEGWTCPGGAWVSWGLGAVATALGSRAPVPCSIFPLHMFSPFSGKPRFIWSPPLTLRPCSGADAAVGRFWAPGHPSPVSAGLWGSCLGDLSGWAAWPSRGVSLQKDAGLGPAPHCTRPGAPSCC